MAYVITQNCCSDAACVKACPVNCIHPTPGEPEYGSADMLFIDPDTCIDCGACADACPVDAIRSDRSLAANDLPFVELNASYYRQRPISPTWLPTPRLVDTTTTPGSLRVAVVGAGPAGHYTVEELLKYPAVVVEWFDRNPAAGGLVRSGVAPDHADTKRALDQFKFPPAKARRLNMHFGVEVGVDIDHTELLDFHHAVIYCSGAAIGPRLDVPGADLIGNHAAVDLAGWYNGHPDRASTSVDLASERAVVIGNGNVALDVARILTMSPDMLATTDIADHALEVLRGSTVREVVVLGRRGPGQAAFTYPELLGLTGVAGVQVRVTPECLARSQPGAGATSSNLSLLHSLSQQPSDPNAKHIVLAFDTEIERIDGSGRVERVTVRQRGGSDGVDRSETLAAGLVVHSIGVRGSAVRGVPFDEQTSRIPNREGRVYLPDTDATMNGVYVAGWAKRGPVGVIGTNKECARHTVASVIEDFTCGVLRRTVGTSGALAELVRSRCAGVVDADGWRAIDITERARGGVAGRPRVKFTSQAELVNTSRTAHGMAGRVRSALTRRA
ncbi:4Fe-4S binding protein [Nocardia nepalensis]|uniref:4Fe-4S binding protein n=1 Tax=Nocardia nepalensis TaxID=3375448 RepID=UPI003B67B24E